MNRSIDAKARALRASGVAAALGLAACAAAPTHFYTLLRPAAASVGKPPAAFRIDVETVDIPAQVKVPQMVVRSSSQELEPVETRRWIAPLDDELREALSADLGALLGTQDVHAVGAAAGGQAAPVYRVKLDVQRFDSALGAYARIDALWSVRSPDDSVVVTCATSAAETVAPGYDALAAGHQRALARIAAAIAAAVQALQQGNPAPACPAG